MRPASRRAIHALTSRSAASGFYAGRFLLYRDGVRAFDPATGSEVEIRRLPRATPAEELVWADERAAQFRRVPSLVDFGLVGQRERFEAHGNGAAFHRSFVIGTAADAAFADFSDMLASCSRGDVRTVSVQHARHTGGIVLRHLARVARVAGFLPLCAAVAHRFETCAELASSCGLVIFALNERRGSRDRDAVAALLRHAMMGTPLVLVCLRADHRRASTAMALREIDAVARYGPMSSLLYGRQATSRRIASLYVHEVSTGYETRDGLPRSVDRAMQRLTHARAAAQRGRFTLATGRFRFAVAALARRGHGRLAGAAALELAEILLGRSDLTPLPGILDAAAHHFREAGDTAGETATLRLRALAATDEGRLQAAEVMARAACAAAAACGDAVLTGGSRLALARCLYWQARYDEAYVLVSQEENLPSALEARRAALASRIAAARHDGASAVKLALDAVEHAERAGAHMLVASTCSVLAAARAMVADADGSRTAIQRAVSAVRLARNRAAALRVRVALIESLVRLEQVTRARRAARNLHGALFARAPALLRARVQAALDPDSVSGFIAASGARALRDGPGRRVRMDVMHDVVEILHACQEVEDSRDGLSRVCGMVRDRLQASTTAVYANWDTRRAVAGAPLAAAGPATDTRVDAAQRAIETGQPIPLSRHGLSMDAAAPVRYGGDTIAALLARWPGDALVDSSRATVLLTAAAAACAPAVRAALDYPGAAGGSQRHGTNVVPELLGTSSVMEDVRRAIELAGRAPFPVLIEGESGSGKELVARAVHRSSPRRERNFCAVNCAALTDELMESELFGHTRGAFTGAIAERAGLFEEADGGTLLLDEVGELSARGQAKLLRVIQEGEVRRIGENFSRKVDVRIIAATNRSLAGEAATGRFRTDLLYRIDVIRIVVPALRERVEDVPILAEHFWHAAITRTGVRAALDPDVLAALARYDWPGNVRELQNVMAALAVRAPRRGRVGAVHLPTAVTLAVRQTPGETLDQARKVFETRFVRAALARAGGHRGRAAADLGLSRQGLAKLMARLDIDVAPQR